MKKVFYNRFVKLFELICILTAVAILLLTGIGINEWVIEREEYIDASLNKYNKEDPIYEIYEDMAGHIDELTNIYKESGMEGLKDHFYYKGISNTYRIIVTTPEEIFVYPENNAYEEEYYAGENVYSDAVKEYALWDREDSFYLRLSSRALIYEGESYSGGEYVFENPKQLYEYLSADTNEYLESIDYKLEMKIAADFTLVRTIYDERNYQWMKDIEEHYGSIEDKILENADIFIICGITIVIATILLLIPCGKVPEGKS